MSETPIVAIMVSDYRQHKIIIVRRLLHGKTHYDYESFPREAISRKTQGIANTYEKAFETAVNDVDAQCK